MLLGGDEIGRTQGGNNNAYAQDNEISWYDWEAVDADLLEFTTPPDGRCGASTRCSGAASWFQGRPIMGERADDIEWFTPEGTTMTEDDWTVSYARSIAVFLNGRGHPPGSATGASASSTTASTRCSTPTRRRWSSCCPTVPTPSAG